MNPRNDGPGKPQSREQINLAIAELVIYTILLPLVLYIAWKHGKKGLLCWPLLASFLVMRFVADGFIIADSSDVERNTIASLFTTAGSITCLTFTIVGMTFEA